MASKDNKKFYDRLKELSQIKGKSNNLNESTINESTLVDYQRSNDGTAYGIVKSNHKYYIKKSMVKEGVELKPTHFVHLSGLQNIKEYEYNTLSEAEKQRNLVIKNLNEAWGKGAIYFKNKLVSKKSPKDLNEDVFKLLRNRINEGQNNNTIASEERFKKGLNKVNEEDISTSDSEINSNESPINKDSSSKEKAQAPINDENAKQMADKNDASGSEGFNKKGDDSKSLAVNQQDDKSMYNTHVNEEALSTKDSKAKSYHDPKKSFGSDKSHKGDLSTSDSEHEDGDIVANKDNASKQKAQAPVNDTNAKKVADKNNAKSNTGFNKKETSKKSLAVNQQSDKLSEDQKKSDPFDEKSKDKNGDESTADSKQKNSDVIDYDSHVEKPTAEYNSYNQPEKAHKEEKGQELKDTAPEKKINENEKDLSTIDSEIEAETSPVNDIEEGDNEDLDQAASALDDLDIAVDDDQPEPNTPDMGGQQSPEPQMGDDMDEPNTPDIGGDQEGDDESPEPDMGDGNMDMPDADQGEDGGDSEEIDKLNGKLTYELRNTELQPDKAKGLMNSFIDAMMNHLGSVGEEDRRKMADDILKATASSADAKSDGGEDDAEQDSEEDENDEMNGAIEDRIKNLSNESDESKESQCEKCGTFESYMNSRGFTNENLVECDNEEMANMISSYADAYEEGVNDGDFEGVAKVMTSELGNIVSNEYGNKNYVDQLQPFVSKVNENDKLKFGVTEPTINGSESFMDEDDDRKADDYAKKFDAELAGRSFESLSDDDKKAIFHKMNVGDVNEKKDVEVEKEEMTESEKKIRKYVRNKLKEFALGKKPNLNEAKSKTLGKLDQYIYKQYLNSKKNYISINESVESLNKYSDFIAIIDFMGDRLTDDDIEELFERAKKVLSIAEIEKLENDTRISGNMYGRISQYDAEMGGLSRY